MYTLTALRRRGFPPEAINLFCARIGVTMSQTILHPDMLDACVREVLNVTAPRYEHNTFNLMKKNFFSRVMVVTDPLKVTITNFPHESVTELNVMNFPGEDSRGSHTIKLDSVVYIERTDFSEVKSAMKHEESSLNEFRKQQKISND